MSRVLPPDEEVARLYAGGMKQVEIARKFGVGSRAVGQAIRNARGMGVKSANYQFVQAGHDPVCHVETHGVPTRAHIELDGVYRRRTLQIHECADLLKEWGIL